jgi:hypothetical protein
MFYDQSTMIVSQHIITWLIDNIMFVFFWYYFFEFDYKDRSANEKKQEGFINRTVGVARDKKIIIYPKSNMTKKDMIILLIIIVIMAHF